jgi:hypothetical protein
MLKREGGSGQSILTRRNDILMAMNSFKKYEKAN